jgi:hypothetical protein
MSRPPATYNELQRTDVAMDDFEGFLKDGNGGKGRRLLLERAFLLVRVGHELAVEDREPRHFGG